MKKNILRIFLFLIISIVTFSATYRISNLNIDADLQKDGSAIVSEAVTYDIGEINGVYFYIDAKGYGGITSLQIFEDNGISNNNEISFNEVDPSNYEVTENDGVYKIKLYSKNNNNTRVFKFVYTLPDAINVYNDVAQLNRKMVGQDWEKNIDHINVTIKVPVSKNYDNSKILVFGHGPLTGEVTKVENTVVYKLDDYYSGDFLEAHILMEPEIFSEFNESKIIHENKKQELLDMEKRLADEANAERERAEKMYTFGKYLFALGGVILGFIEFLILKTKKSIIKGYEREIPFGKYSREIPNLSPAAVGSIITKKIDENEILATILDLIRKKMLSLETIGDHNFLTLIGDTNTDKLTEAEQIILDIYINDFGDGKVLDLDTLKSSLKKLPKGVEKKFRKWVRIIEKVPSQEGFKDIRLLDFAENNKSLKLIRIPIALIAISSVFLSYFNLWILILLPLSIPVAFSLFKVLPNKKKYTTERELVAFKNFLSDYSQLEEAKIAHIHLWEEYFVYAVALGVSEKVVKAYKKALDMGIIEEDLTQLSSGSLISSMEDMTSIGALNTVASKSFKSYSIANQRSINQVRKSTWSSSSGGGGGFSSGSSGGGGSRGGGGAF